MHGACQQALLSITKLAALIREQHDVRNGMAVCVRASVCDCMRVCVFVCAFVGIVCAQIHV